MFSNSPVHVLTLGTAILRDPTSPAFLHDDPFLLIFHFPADQAKPAFVFLSFVSFAVKHLARNGIDLAPRSSITLGPVLAYGVNHVEYERFLGHVKVAHGRVDEVDSRFRTVTAGPCSR